MQPLALQNKTNVFKIVFMGWQHVLVMYAGAVAVPLILGAALKLPKDQVAFLINADLFACGIATLIQCIGFANVGIRLPVMMGVTFTAIGPLIAIGTDPQAGLLQIFGATIAAGIFGFLVAPFIGKIIRFFPPVVTGTEILAVGLSLMVVAASWSAGGYGNPEFGNPLYIAIAAAVLVAILLIVRFARGFLSNISILLGLMFGFLLAFGAGQIDFKDVGNAPWVGVVVPFHFGVPQFSLWPIVAMCIVMLVTFIESTGMFLALGEVVDKKVTEKDLVRGFRADGVGTALGGIFNTFPYTSYAQNIGLISITGVKSRWVCALAGLFLVLLALFPKVAMVIASIPPYVLGGAGLVMFGMVAASGIKVLSRVSFSDNKNLYVVAISVAVGMIPVVSPQFFSRLPKDFAPILESPVLLTAIFAVVLNVFFNGFGSKEEAESSLLVAAKEAEV